MIPVHLRKFNQMKKNTILTTAFAFLFTLGLALGTVNAATTDTDPPKKEQKETEPKKADAEKKEEKKACCSSKDAKKESCSDSKKTTGETTSTPTAEGKTAEAKAGSCCSTKKAS